MKLKIAVIGSILFISTLLFSCDSTLKDPQAEWERLVELEKDEGYYTLDYDTSLKPGYQFNNYKYTKLGSDSFTSFSMVMTHYTRIEYIFADYIVLRKDGKSILCSESADYKTACHPQEDLVDFFEPFFTSTHDMFNYKNYLKDKKIAGRTCHEFLVSPKADTVYEYVSEMSEEEGNSVTITLCLDKELGYVAEYNYSISSLHSLTGESQNSTVSNAVVIHFSKDYDPELMKKIPEEAANILGIPYNPIDPIDDENTRLAERCTGSSDIPCLEKAQFVAGEPHKEKLTFAIRNNVGGNITILGINGTGAEGSSECISSEALKEDHRAHYIIGPRRDIKYNLSDQPSIADGIKMIWEISCSENTENKEILAQDFYIYYKTLSNVEQKALIEIRAKPRRN